MTAEERRLKENQDRSAHWRRWGPYLSERQWGTVREDYSADGTAWEYFPHDHARSRAYRWGEDGLAGICDDQQRLCFALALWNGRDPILKERLFGLTGTEGNHGEDVKEYYFYLDATPTHSYMKCLYKYPQARVSVRASWSRRTAGADGSEPEFELLDTGVFDDDRYFDVFVEYAKAAPDDILIRITVDNRGPEAAPLHLLPHALVPQHLVVGARARRARGCARSAGARLTRDRGRAPIAAAALARTCEGAPELLFTENETNSERLCGVAERRRRTSRTPSTTYVVGTAADAVNPARRGHARPRPTTGCTVGAGETRHVSRCGCATRRPSAIRSAADFDAVCRASGRTRPTSSTRT